MKNIVSPRQALSLVPLSIKGAIPRADSAEGQQLWAGCPYLRPKDHSEWLRHFINLELNLAKLLAGWVPAASKLEWKLEIPHYIFEGMQHAYRMRERLVELPKASRDVTATTPTLAAFIAAIGPAEHAATFYKTFFSQLLPSVLAAYETYLDRCDEIWDAPIIYTLRGIVVEKQRQLDDARIFFDQHPLVSDRPDEARAYGTHFSACLSALKTLTPDHAALSALPPSPIHNPAGPSPKETIHDPAMRLTDRGFPANTAEGNPFGATLQEIVYHNATEWQVVAPMCHVFYETPTMPLEFYVEYARHIWDECRHAGMGLRRIRELGFDREDFVFPDGGDKPESPEAYIATLVLIGETCSFNRKRGSIIPFLRQGDYRSAMLPEVDCVDEKMHVGYGHKWIPELYLRARNDTRDFKIISEEVRRAFIDTIEKLKTAPENERKAILGSLPIFCSNMEFSHLDFDQNIKREPSPNPN